MRTFGLTKEKLNAYRLTAGSQQVSHLPCGQCDTWALLPDLGWARVWPLGTAFQGQLDCMFPICLKALVTSRALQPPQARGPTSLSTLLSGSQSKKLLLHPTYVETLVRIH